MRFSFVTFPAFDLNALQDVMKAFHVQHCIVASEWHCINQGFDSVSTVCVQTLGANSLARRAYGTRLSVPSLRGRTNSPLQVRVCCRWETT